MFQYSFVFVMGQECVTGTAASNGDTAVPRLIDEQVWSFGGMIGDRQKPKCL